MDKKTNGGAAHQRATPTCFGTSYFYFASYYTQQTIVMQVTKPG
jgi:hypothetical protein